MMASFVLEARGSIKNYRGFNMRCVKVVFSPTGGTQRVADAIVGEWGEHIDSVDLTDAGNDYSKVGLQEIDIVLGIDLIIIGLKISSHDYDVIPEAYIGYGCFLILLVCGILDFLSGRCSL